MNSAGSFIASYLVNSVWEVSLIAIAGWLVSRALKRLGPQAEHITWVASLLLALVTPALPMLRGMFSHATGAKGTAHSSALLMSGTAITGHIVGAPMLFHRVILFVLYAYGATLFYFLARFAVSLRRTSAIQKDSHPAKLKPEQQAAWAHAKHSLALGDVDVRASMHVSGPVTLGIRKPVLLMPESFLNECDLQDLLAALAHEAAHIRRRDFQKNILFEICSLPLSFHPALWMIKSQIAQTRELVCDRIATEQIIDRKQYGDSLLRLAAMVFAASRTPASNAIGIFDANILKKRILVMKTASKQFSLAAKFGFMVPAILLLVAFAVGESALAVSVNPAAPQQASELDPSTLVHQFGGNVKAPSLLHSVDPEFPRSQNLPDQFSANCEVWLVVDATGMPQHVRVVRSIGPEFDANVIKAVEQYRFKPATKDGQPVAASLYIDVNFTKIPPPQK